MQLYVIFKKSSYKQENSIITSRRLVINTTSLIKMFKPIEREITLTSQVQLKG